MAFFKSFLMKTMLKQQLKNVPPEQQERILKVVEKNPDLFTTIAEQVEKRVKGGMSQHEAMMSVMKAHREELQKAMME